MLLINAIILCVTIEYFQRIGHFESGTHTARASQHRIVGFFVFGETGCGAPCIRVDSWLLAKWHVTIFASPLHSLVLWVALATNKTIVLPRWTSLSSLCDLWWWGLVRQWSVGSTDPLQFHRRWYASVSVACLPWGRSLSRLPLPDDAALSAGSSLPLSSSSWTSYCWSWWFWPCFSSSGGSEPSLLSLGLLTLQQGATRIVTEHCKWRQCSERQREDEVSRALWGMGHLFCHASIGTSPKQQRVSIATHRTTSLWHFNVWLTQKPLVLLSQAGSFWMTCGTTYEHLCVIPTGDHWNRLVFGWSRQTEHLWNCEVFSHPKNICLCKTAKFAVLLCGTMMDCCWCCNRPRRPSIFASSPVWSLITAQQKDVILLGQRLSFCITVKCSRWSEEDFLFFCCCTQASLSWCQSHVFKQNECW